MVLMNGSKGAFLGFLLMPLVSYAQPAWLNDGLVAYYPLDGDGKDASGNGNNTRPVDEKPKYYYGDRFGNNPSENYPHAPHFENKYGLVTDSDDFPNESQARTMSLWFVVHNPGGSMQEKGEGDEYRSTLLSQGPRFEGDEAYEIGLSFIPSRGICRINVFARERGYEFWGKQSITPYNWHHVAIVYDGEGGHSAFVDGVSYSIRASGASYPINTAEGPLRFGHLGILNEEDIGSTFSGQLDDVRIYDRALSESEIVELFQHESKPEHVIWERKIEGSVHSSTPLNIGTYQNVTGAETKLVVLGNDLNCLDPLTGEVIWVYDEEGGFTSNDHRFNSPMFMENGNVAFSGHDSGEVVMLSGDTGEVIWKKSVNSRIYAPLARGA